MTTECLITFDNNPDGVYYGGQTISGSVKLKTVNTKTIRAIYITIDGRAKVKWNEKKSSRNANGVYFYTETYTAQEQYLSSKDYVVGDESSLDQVLPIGIHNYTFEVLLPDELPSSFIGRHGSVMYDLKITIVRPMIFDNEFRQPFTVISPLDLNTNPSYNTPQKIIKKKDIWCACFIMQPMIIKAFIPHSGYAPGQQIPIKIVVNNNSQIDCNGVEIKLHKIVKFTAHSPDTKRRCDTIQIFEKRLPEVLRESKKRYTEYIPLPSIAPSTLETCHIIDVCYNIQVTVEIAGCYSNVYINFPITIGTVPLYEITPSSPNVITEQPTAPIALSGADSPPAYFAMTPPTFEEATAAYVVPFEDNDDETSNHIKPVSFMPKYPVYYNFPVPSAPPANSFEYNITGPQNSTNPNGAGTTSLQPQSNQNENRTGQITTTYGWSELI